MTKEHAYWYKVQDMNSFMKAYIMTNEIILPHVRMALIEVLNHLISNKNS